MKLIAGAALAAAFATPAFGAQAPDAGNVEILHRHGTPEQRAHDILAVLDAVGSERAVVVGFSEGGYPSMLLAATRPEAPMYAFAAACGGFVLAMVRSPRAAVRWGVAKSILTAWVLTFPAAALAAAICYWIAHLFLP